MNSTFHNDVRSTLIDRLNDWYSGELPADPHDLAFELLADENTNGTHFFSRQSAADYIEANETEVNRVADEARGEWGELNDPEDDPEGFHVQCMLYLGCRIMDNVLERCGVWYDVDVIDNDMKRALIDELAYENRAGTLVV